MEENSAVADKTVSIVSSQSQERVLPHDLELLPGFMSASILEPLKEFERPSSGINSVSRLPNITVPEVPHIQDASDQGITPVAPPGFPLPIYQEQHHTLRIGAMQFLSDVADPVFQKMLPETSDDHILGKEGAEIYKRHFAPNSESDKVINIPIGWANFLSLALLSLERFEWAKSLLASQIWNYILEGSDRCIFKPFVIPDKCISTQAPACKLQVLQQIEEQAEIRFSTPQSKSPPKEIDLQPSSTSVVHANRKRKGKIPLVESEVRRSEILKLVNQGYKRNVCLDKNCLACNADPPIVSSKIVRNLNTTFCKVKAPSDLFVLPQNKTKKTKLGVEATRRSQRKGAGPQVD